MWAPARAGVCVHVCLHMSYLDLYVYVRACACANVCEYAYVSYNDDAHVNVSVPVTVKNNVSAEF